MWKMFDFVSSHNQYYGAHQLLQNALAEISDGNYITECVKAIRNQSISKTYLAWNEPAQAFLWKKATQRKFYCCPAEDGMCHTRRTRS
jgi:hypothetical protein